MQLADLRARLADALDPDPAPAPPPDTLLAGVLLPILEAEEPSVVFTRRTEHLPRHAGEVSFPGGLRHGDDPDLRATALRETQEELGLAPSSVDILGALPPVHTFVSGILIVPFVGVLTNGIAFEPDEGEIAEVLEYPLVELIRAETVVEFPRDGHVYRGHAFEMEGATIWGATARILHELLQALRGEPT